MKFKSQICTTVEQSKRLLELGLKRETADMILYNDDENNPNSYVEYCIEYKELVDTKNIRCLAFQFIANKCIPAWSLHRLLMMFGDNYSFFSLENAYGELVHAIAIDIEKGTFNKDYLEEKK